MYIKIGKYLKYVNAHTFSYNFLDLGVNPISLPTNYNAFMPRRI